jgi:hypothetical protein
MTAGIHGGIHAHIASAIYSGILPCGPLSGHVRNGAFAVVFGVGSWAVQRKVGSDGATDHGLAIPGATETTSSLSSYLAGQAIDKVLFITGAVPFAHGQKIFKPSIV